MTQGIHRHQTPPPVLKYATQSITAKRDVIHKTGSTWHVATLPEEDGTTDTEDMDKKFVKIGLAIPEICGRADTRNRLIAILRSPTGRSNEPAVEQLR